MGPKKATTAAPKKAAAAPAHASYLDMVKDAIINLKERNGSSRQAIQKYIKANNNLGDVSDAMFKSHVNRAIASGDKNGTFTRPKGASGTVKLAQKKPAPAKKEKEPKPVAEKKEKKAPAATKAKKPATTKAKTAAPKKTTAKAPKKTTAAAKPKANASKPRKTAAPAAAVEAEVSRVLGKTKSGRVTKSKAPATAAKPKKAAAAKKAAPKKAAAAKKAATPKKATPKKAEVGSAPRSVGRPRKST